MPKKRNNILFSTRNNLVFKQIYFSAIKQREVQYAIRARTSLK